MSVSDPLDAANRAIVTVRFGGRAVLGADDRDGTAEALGQSGRRTMWPNRRTCLRFTGNVYNVHVGLYVVQCMHMSDDQVSACRTSFHTRDRKGIVSAQIAPVIADVFLFLCIATSRRAKKQYV